LTAQMSEVGEVLHHDSEFDCFYRTYHPRLLTYARRRFAELDADEIASETMARALERFWSLDRRASPMPWLQVVARHVATDMRRARTVCAPSSDDLFVQMANVGERCPDEQVIGREQARMVGQTMERLSASDRRLMSLRLMDEMSHEEIATVLGTTTPAARQQYRRARARFLTCFTSLGGELRAVVPLPVLATLWQRFRRASSGVLSAAPGAVQMAGLVGTLAVGSFGAALLPFAMQPVRPVASDGLSMPHMASTAFVRGDPDGPARPAGRLSGELADGSATMGVEAAAGPATGAAQVSRRPFAPGKTESHKVTVPTPVGTVYVQGDGGNSAGMRVVCLVPGVDCS
jgi:RNA polymerase sigma-70 factor (ECF subfamily)